MTNYELAMIAMAGFSLLLNVLIAAVGLTWGLSKVRDTVRKEIENELGRLERTVGETFTALRQKVQDVELYVRDHFVRRDSFAQAMTNFSEEVRGNFAKMDARLERMENKIDSRR